MLQVLSRRTSPLTSLETAASPCHSHARGGFRGFCTSSFKLAQTTGDASRHLKGFGLVVRQPAAVHDLHLPGHHNFFTHAQGSQGQNAVSKLSISLHLEQSCGKLPEARLQPLNGERLLDLCGTTHGSAACHAGTATLAIYLDPEPLKKDSAQACCRSGHWLPLPCTWHTPAGPGQLGIAFEQVRVR